jgi:NAD(P)-dependent dehydrogenase (short-subunit alcohol dehydrogenase family)
VQFVKQLLEKGNTVLASVRDPDVAQLARLKEARPNQLSTLALDVADYNSISAWASKVVEATESVDVRSAHVTVLACSRNRHPTPRYLDCGPCAPAACTDRVNRTATTATHWHQLQGYLTCAGASSCWGTCELGQGDWGRQLLEGMGAGPWELFDQAAAVLLAAVHNSMLVICVSTLLRPICSSSAVPAPVWPQSCGIAHRQWLPVLQVVINNAGVLLRGGIEDTSPELMIESYKVNCMGPIFVVQALLRKSLLKQGALIATVTSLVRPACSRPRPHFPCPDCQSLPTPDCHVSGRLAQQYTWQSVAGRLAWQALARLGRLRDRARHAGQAVETAKPVAIRA